MPKKENNKRRFPGEKAGYLRPDRGEKRREEAATRQKAYDALSPQQKLVALNEKLGDGVGAKKQRNKLQKPVEQPSSDTISEQTNVEAQKLPDEILQQIELLNQGSDKKKLKAKDRRAQEHKS